MLKRDKGNRYIKLTGVEGEKCDTGEDIKVRTGERKKVFTLSSCAGLGRRT